MDNHSSIGFSGLENSARKGDGRDGGLLLFPNPCCNRVLFDVTVPTALDRTIQQAMLNGEEVVHCGITDSL